MYYVSRFAVSTVSSVNYGNIGVISIDFQTLFVPVPTIHTSKPKNRLYHCHARKFWMYEPYDNERNASYKEHEVTSRQTSSLPRLLCDYVHPFFTHFRGV